MPNGVKIEATWENDKKNGRGFITDEKGKRAEAEFFEDVFIKQSDQNPDFYNLAPLNLLLCLIFFGLVWWAREGTFKKKNDYVGVYVMAVIAYFGMLIESGMSRTYSYLSNVIHSSKSR